MKKNGLLLLLLLVLGGAAFYLWKQKGNKKGSNVSWDMDFGVQDTSQVTKVFMADRKGHKILLERKSNYWTVNGGDQRARPTGIEILLGAFAHQQVKYIPTESVRKNMIAGLGSMGIKTEIYLNGSDKPAKVFYVGDVTQDETGTHMMMEGSEQPYVVHIPNFVGGLRGRYLLTLDDWKDRSVFREDPSAIQTISVEYPTQKSASFILDKQGSSFVAKPFYVTQQTYPAQKQRKGIAESYAIQFRSLVAEAFETHSPVRDSVSALIPFCIVSVTKTDGSIRQAKFHPTEVQHERSTGQPFVFRYYAEGNWGDFMLVQQTVFGPVFRGYDYFFDVAKNEDRILR
jgi:Domain of unknown function (DUF4340)